MKSLVRRFKNECRHLQRSAALNDSSARFADWTSRAKSICMSTRQVPILHHPSILFAAGQVFGNLKQKNHHPKGTVSQEITGVEGGIIQMLFSMAVDSHHKILILFRGHSAMYKKSFRLSVVLVGILMAYCLDNTVGTY